MNHRVRCPLALAAIAVAVLGEVAAPSGRSNALVVADVAAGGAFFLLAVLLVPDHGSRWQAAASAAAGTAWFVANLGSVLPSLYVPLAIHAVLMGPRRRVGRPERMVEAAAWVSILPAVRDVTVVRVVIGLGVACVALSTVWRGRPAQRREAVLWARPSLVLGVAIAGPAVVRLAQPVSDLADDVAIAHAVLIAVAGALAAAAAATRTADAPQLADDVVELAEVRSQAFDAVMASLAGPLHDNDRTVDPSVRAALDTVVGLIDDNRDLQRTLREQAVEVRRSRTRLVEAADTERRRLARDLSERGVRHLDLLDETLRSVAELPGTDSGLISRVLDQLDGAKDELEQLGRGLHPRLLVDGGLSLALDDLSRRSVVPIIVHAPRSRYAPIVESTAWYVCVEAVANATKHASANAISVDVSVDVDEVEASGLRLTISDDGVGGASADAGTGLAGLADRVAAAGGSLDVESSTGVGTKVSAWLPIR